LVAEKIRCMEARRASKGDKGGLVVAAKGGQKKIKKKKRKYWFIKPH